MRTTAPIGVAGRMGAAKTTVANYLAETKGCIPFALADSVRAALLKVNPIVALDGRTVQDVIESADWQSIKSDPVVGPEIRGLLQRLGTDFVREMLGPDTWLYAAERHLDAHFPKWWHETGGPQMVIHDIRFNNEAKWIKLNRGIVINVVRPGGLPGPRDFHESERGIDSALADYTVLNVGSLDELYEQVDGIYRREFGRVRSA